MTYVWTCKCFSPERIFYSSCCLCAEHMVGFYLLLRLDMLYSTVVSFRHLRERYLWLSICLRNFSRPTDVFEDYSRKYTFANIWEFVTTTWGYVKYCCERDGGRGTTTTFITYFRFFVMNTQFMAFFIREKHLRHSAHKL